MERAVDDKQILEILSKVQRGYDKVSEKFSSTRRYMWGDLSFIKKIVRKNDDILDFGCGNGRLVAFLEGKYHKYIGLDVGKKLISIAKNNHESEKNQFYVIDLKRKKNGGSGFRWQENAFDKAFAIAVFHHFPSRNYRIKRAKDLYRILKPGGKCIISVWNLWNKDHMLSILKASLGISKKFPILEFGDLYIPFQTNEFIFHRYLHAFSKKELEGTFKRAGFSTVKCWRTKKNIIYIGQKPL